MELLLAFSPFLAFLGGERLLGIVPGLCAGAAVAIALIVRDRLRGGREIPVLEVGTAALFTALAACAAWMNGVAWSVGLVRLVVDCGLMLLVLGGVVARRPFALGFTRPRTPASDEGLRLHQRIALAWAAAFGLLALADLVSILAPTWPVVVPLMIGGAGLLAALKFTRRLVNDAALRPLSAM